MRRRARREGARGGACLCVCVRAPCAPTDRASRRRACPRPPRKQILRKAEADANDVNPHVRICREAGVNEALRALNHAPANVYNKAISIADTYFADDEERNGGGGGDDD